MVILGLMTDEKQKPVDQTGSGPKHRPRRGIKSRREFYLRQSRLRTIFVTGIVLFEAIAIIALFFIATGYGRETETGIFVKPLPVSKARSCLSDPYVAVVRVVPGRSSFRSDSIDGGFPDVTFMLDHRRFSFEELDVYLNRPSNRTRYFDGIIFWIDRRALNLMNHGDIVALCDMIKMNRYCRIGLAADGYDWSEPSW